MELNNAFTIALPVEEAWALLTDLERIAPCMPGAELHEIDGAEHRGVVKVKVGPIVARYQGVATIREQDEVARRAVVRAEGRDTRGQGNAAATITVTLAPEGTGTHVDVHTDLSITGKVAQFGRGVLADVSRKLMTQSAQTLEAQATPEPEPRPKPGPETAADARPGPDTEAAPVADAEAGTETEAGTATGAAADTEAEARAGAHTEPTPVADAGGGAEGGVGGGVGSGAAASAGVDATGGGGVEVGRRRVVPVEAAPVDLLAVSGGSLSKRLGPVVAAVLVAALVLRRLLGG